MIDSPMVARHGSASMPLQVSAMRDKGSPTGKQGTGWDTAHLAAFPGQPGGRIMFNGLELPLDGGFTAKAPDNLSRRSRPAPPATDRRPF